MATATATEKPDLWARHVKATDTVTDRLNRITGASTEIGMPFALVGGQAVAIWGASTDPAAVRATKNVDILIELRDLAKARAAANKAGLDYFEVLDVGMFLERTDPNPRYGVHLILAGEKVKAESLLPSPKIDEREEISRGKPVVTLAALVRMKLMANRDQDRVHLRDMIDVGLIDRAMRAGLPNELAERLDALLTDAGR